MRANRPAYLFWNSIATPSYQYHDELDMTDTYKFILDILLVYLTRGWSQYPLYALNLTYHYWFETQTYLA